MDKANKAVQTKALFRATVNHIFWLLHIVQLWLQVDFEMPKNAFFFFLRVKC